MKLPTTITRDQFAPIRPLLEGCALKTRPRKYDLYDVFCALLHRHATGCAWRALPARFPPWRTVNQYETNWNTYKMADGRAVWLHALERLS